MTLPGLVRVEAGSTPFEQKLAGLSLLARAVRVLAKAGLAPIRVLSVPEAVERVRSVLRAQGLEEIEVVSEMPDQPTVTLSHDVVCDTELVRAVARAPGPVRATRGNESFCLERTDPGKAPSRFDVGARFIVRVDGPKSAERAKRALFQACRKPVDGIVSRHLNRYVSLFLSKLLVDTPITPNMTTVATLFVGLLAALAVSRGGYEWTLAGAALLQCNSILDGVDGELARVRHQQSHLGQWLDTASDDLVNVVFWAALGFGASTLPDGHLLAAAGYVAATAQLVIAVTYWVELYAMGSGDVGDIEWWFHRDPPSGLRGRALALLLYIPKKDFFILFCLVCAVVGVLPQMLPLFALAGVCTAAVALYRGVSKALRLLPARPQIDGLGSRRIPR